MPTPRCHPMSDESDGCLLGKVSHAVRVGNTVVRDAGPWTPTIHALLRHLKHRGFPAPEVLGVNGNGREVLRWIDGQPCTRPWPELLRGDAGMIALGALLRQYHTAVSDFDPGPDATWRIGLGALRSGDIVRHGDLGPYNVIFVGGSPAALIDWDLAEPGIPLQDIAQLVWYAVPLRLRATWTAAAFCSPPPFARRLAALCEGYGWEGERAEVVDAVAALQAVERERLLTWGRAGIYPWSHFLAIGDLDELEGEIRWLAGNGRQLA